LVYRVYTPEGISDTDKLVTIYITDGQWKLDQAKMKSDLDHEISIGYINPVIAIFVDNRDPDNLSKNRRNQQFMCNKDYAIFYMDELVPTTDKNFIKYY
jgi:enterochelin esterase-like enzyme